MTTSDESRHRAAGRLLAQRHEADSDAERQPQPSVSLVNVGESARTGDWTLRSALVRFAQPQPALVGATMELVRRCDAALAPHARHLESTTVTCDRDLSIETVVADGHTWQLQPATDPYPDARAADLARLVDEDSQALSEIVAGYQAHTPLSDDEVAALPLLSVVVELDRLGDRLARWADAGPAEPPVEEVERVAARVYRRLEELGVAREERGRPPRRRS